MYSWPRFAISLYLCLILGNLPLSWKQLYIEQFLKQQQQKSVYLGTLELLYLRKNLVHPLYTHRKTKHNFGTKKVHFLYGEDLLEVFEMEKVYLTTETLAFFKGLFFRFFPTKMKTLPKKSVFDN